MKKYIKYSLFGILYVFIVNIISFFVTLPIPNPWDTYEPGNINPEVYRHLVSLQFLLTAIPSAIAIYLLLKFVKTKNKRDTIECGIIWIAILIMHYIIIGIGNENLIVIFGGVTIYIHLILCILGIILFVKFNRLK